MADEKTSPIVPEKMDKVNSQAVVEGFRGTRGSASQLFTRLGAQVYKIAQQMMNKHYCINISDLVTSCTRFIKNATKRDIIEEIDRLEREKVLFDGTALTIDDVLENPTRKELLEIVSTSPGINFSRLRNTTGKGNHLLAWHLAVLEKFAFLRSTTIDGSQVYLPKDAPPEHDVLNAFLNKPGMRELLLLLARYGKMKGREIELALKLPHATAFRRLQKLVERGLIQELVDEENDATWYEIKPAWIEPIRKL